MSTPHSQKTKENFSKDPSKALFCGLTPRQGWLLERRCFLGSWYQKKGTKHPQNNPPRCWDARFSSPFPKKPTCPIPAIMGCIPAELPLVGRLLQETWSQQHPQGRRSWSSGRQAVGCIPAFSSSLFVGCTWASPLSFSGMHPHLLLFPFLWDFLTSPISSF